MLLQLNLLYVRTIKDEGIDLKIYSIQIFFI